MAQAEIALGDDADKFSVMLAVFRNCNSRMSCLLDALYKFRKRMVRADIRIGRNKTCFICLYVGNHSCLVCNCL